MERRVTLQFIMLALLIFGFFYTAYTAQQLQSIIMKESAELMVLSSGYSELVNKVSNATRLSVVSVILTGDSDLKYTLFTIMIDNSGFVPFTISRVSLIGITEVNINVTMDKSNLNPNELSFGAAEIGTLCQEGKMYQYSIKIVNFAEETYEYTGSVVCTHYH